MKRSIEKSIFQLCIFKEREQNRYRLNKKRKGENKTTKIPLFHIY